MWQPTPVSLPGESCGQRSLAGFSLWGHKDMTESTEHARMLEHSKCSTAVVIILLSGECMFLGGECMLLGSGLSQQRFGATDIKALCASQLLGLGQTMLQLLGK